MKKTLISTSILLTLTLGATGVVQASTEAQKQAAIDVGLAWLAPQQASDGSWCASGYCAADTASVLLAMIEQKSKPLGWNGADYSTQVTNGLQYLMNSADIVNTGGALSKNIGTAGTPIMVTPDGNNNATGLIWGGGESTYVTGLVLPALAKAATTAGIATPTTLINSPNLNTNGKTYQQVIQDAADAFAWGQSTQGPSGGSVYQGGWHYFPSQGDADNSTTQWGAIGLSFAQTVPGVTVPQFVKNELTNWINYIQGPSGGSGYQDPGSIVNESKTGGLLVEMAFTGYSGTVTGPADKSNKAGAIGFLNTNWQNEESGTWYGNFGHPYAMWSVYKGLESTIGLTGADITNFKFTGAAQVQDPTDGAWNWWEDYCQWLTINQNGNGSWNGYDYWNAQLATAWGINILNATETGLNPGPTVPEPSTFFLFGAGLLGLTRFARRRKN